MAQIIIDASKKGLKLNPKEIWEYKDLLFTLAYRDLRVRYAQTILGPLWVLIQPLTTLLIFTLIFGRVAKIDTGDIPYPLFAIAGMSGWTYFSTLLSQAGGSIIGAQAMVAKIYFPRMILPLSKSITGLIDLGVVYFFMIILMVYYQFIPSVTIFILPVFIFIAMLSALTVGIWFSALTVRFRDFQQVIPFLVQAGMYITPVAYPANLIPEELRFWYFLNPMAGVVEGIRWALLGGDVPGILTWLSISFVFILFFAGLYFFRSVERVMADIV